MVAAAHSSRRQERQQCLTPRRRQRAQGQARCALGTRPHGQRIVMLRSALHLIAGLAQRNWSRAALSCKFVVQQWGELLRCSAHSAVPSGCT